MASSRGRQATRNDRQPLPFWVGLVSGFFLGIVVASVFIYRDYQLERRRAEEDRNARAQPAMSPPPRTAPSLPPVLTQPVAPANQPRLAPAPAPAPPVVSTPPAAAVPAAVPAPAPAPAAATGRSLVAGSLRSRGEAEQRKAELALLGVSSRVVETRVNGEQRFRVTVGPFRSDTELEQTRAQLRSNGVDSFPTQ
ncbi:MAG: SPOR domain-containing protein [Xanthomonadales bacterium]|jgi:cell division protein FtsN|nr:SPOR domain-containing protein [Xanthomonadales bacterium]